MRDTARPAVLTVDVETDDGRGARLLVPFVKWEGDVAVYQAAIGAELGKRAKSLTATGMRCHTLMTLRFLGDDDGD